MRRRTLLLSGLGAAGALIVGWGVLPMRSRLGGADTQALLEGEVGLNGWIKIAADGRVLLAMPRSEMGQGVHTALAQLVAEELNVELAQIELVAAGHESLYGNVQNFVDNVLPTHPDSAEPGQETRMVRASEWVVGKVARELGLNITGGSASVADAWDVVRLAAATARSQLLGAASLQWKLPRDELQIERGVVSHPSGNSAHFGQLAKAASATPPGTVELKAMPSWRVIGRSVPRIDLPAKVNGQARYGIDIRLPGMVFAVVRHAPAMGGAPGRVDSEAAMRLPGVERIVRLPGYAGSSLGVAVVGRSYWHAQRGAAALEIDWRPRPAGAIDSAAIEATLEQTAREAATNHGGAAFHSEGDAKTALHSSVTRVEALYQAPYLAHAAMEPNNCTARVYAGKVEIWSSTQVPGLARALAATVAGVEPADVTVHVPYLGGGFGRRLDADVVGQAVRVAMETGGRPVQLVWSREEDMANDFYRPAGAAFLQAGFNSAGKLTALAITSAGDAVSPRWMERNAPGLAGPVDLPDKTTADGLFNLPYLIPHQRMAHVATRHPVPVGYWRSVGHSHNAFFSESFIDELALAAKQDPVAYRLALLEHRPRHAEVLRLAADKAGWGRELPKGRARGVALHESFGTIVAEVVEASIEAGKIRVHRVTCAVDCGIVVNPGIVKQQIEGGVIFGLTAALYGRIEVRDGQVQQRNFPDYPLMTLAQAPVIETHLIDSLNRPRGAGEPGTPPAAPALANALFALTGVRQRRLPLVAATRIS